MIFEFVLLKSAPEEKMYYTNYTALINTLRKHMHKMNTYMHDEYVHKMNIGLMNMYIDVGKKSPT